MTLRRAAAAARCTFLLCAAMAAGLQTAAAAAESPEAVVKATADQLISVVESERDALRDDPVLLRSKITDIIAPHFDFPRMTQWAVGKHWRRATEEQRAELVAGFQSLLIGTYSSALLEYTDQNIVYHPVQAEPGAEKVTVKTEIEQPGGVPIPVNYRMHERDGDWKVYDVAVDGVSFVTTYRADFAAVIRSSGIDGLIQTLAERRSANARQ